jgi:hypothetical protein
MHPSFLAVSSPKGKRNLTQIKKEKMEQIYHLSMKQVSQFKEFYDDVKYQQRFVTKFIVLGRIKEVTKAISPKNLPILKIKIDDGTTNWRENKPFTMYDVKKEDKLSYALKQNLYLKIGCQTKISGLVYKTELQITGMDIKLVEDFN